MVDIAIWRSFRSVILITLPCNSCLPFHSSTEAHLKPWQRIQMTNRHIFWLIPARHITSATKGSSLQISLPFPLSSPFNTQQVRGTVAVTHSGTIILEVDPVHGKVPFTLTNVLFIDSLPFNIPSLQKLVEGDFIPVYNEIPDKVVLKKILPHGAVEQAALLSKSKAGRLTLDCKILRSTLSQPSTRH